MKSRLRFLNRITAIIISGLMSVAQTSLQQVPNVGRETQTKVILGVLEDLPGENAGESDFRAVRTIFRKVGDDWEAFPTKTRNYRDLQTLPTSYPKEMTWTIAFDGRSLGSVTSHTPSQFKLYTEIGIGKISSQNHIPTVGIKSIDYSGSLHKSVYRPLVAVSQPHVSDPERWKRGQLSHELIVAARQQFRGKFPKAVNCKNPEENIGRRWKYRDEDIQVTIAYSSINGWSLIELNLTGNACDGEQEFQDAFHGQWFVIEPTGAVRYLRSDMWLVDAGDYDNDGSSEVLFAIDEHNKGGYRLFYRNFSRSSEFAFHYH